MQQGNSPWSGIQVFPGTNNDLDTRLRGDSILITAARVVENNGLTQLQDVFATYISSGRPIPTALSLPFDSIRLNRASFLEPYEDMLIKLDTNYVVNNNPNTPQNFNRFLVNPDSSQTVGVRIEDESNDIPNNFNVDSLASKQKLNYIYGILSFALNNWRVLPRNRADIQGFGSTVSVGIKETTFGINKFNVYPNPAVNTLVVNLPELRNDLNIQIIDLSGRVLYSKQLKNVLGGIENIDVQNLNNGVYLLNFISNGEVETKRIVVQH
jgi:hypothetical protein